jgi:hypothetical protein
MEPTLQFRPVPLWSKKAYLLAGAIAIAVTPAVWLARNFLSDAAFWRTTQRLRTPEAYELYLAKGWRHVDEARKDLVQVTLEDARRRGSTTALRRLASRNKGKPLEKQAGDAIDELIGSVLVAPGPAPGGVEPLAAPEAQRILAKTDPARVNTTALGTFVPAKGKGVACAADWWAALAGGETKVKRLMAQAMLRSGCPDFLPSLVETNQPLLKAYSGAIDEELRRPAQTTALTFRQIRDRGIVRSNAALFPAASDAALLDAIRSSEWSPKGGPAAEAQAEIQAALGGDPALSRAVLDYLARHAPSWGAPPGNLAKDKDLRVRLVGLLDLAARTQALGRADLAKAMAAPAESAFREEIAAVERKPAAEIELYLAGNPNNPFLAELVDRLAAQGRDVVAYAFDEKKDTGWSTDVANRLKAATGGRFLVFACPSRGCDRIKNRVRIRVTQSANQYCYDKNFFGMGICNNRGQQIRMTLTYVRAGQAVGSDVVSAETPDVVSYRRLSGGVDFGPSSSDVQSATSTAFDQALAQKKLTVPF